MGLRTFATASVACLVVACGGGGGSGVDAGDGGGGSATVLQMAVSYGSASLALFQQANHRPSMDGFQGHAPHCELVSGRVPAGTQLQRDCSITGVPTAVEAVSFTVRVGADGASNTIDAGGSLNVFGPRVHYGVVPTARNLQVGSNYGEFPIVDWNQIVTGPQLTWNYALKGGSLPPGMVLDASTGLIHGTATAAGTFSVEVQVSATSDDGTFPLPETAGWAAVVMP